MKLYISALRKEFLKGRPPRVYGKAYSCVLFGKCNFRCKFCFAKGDKADCKGIFPDAVLMDYGEVEKWVIDEAKRGVPIKITGGEPALFPEATIKLLKVAKRYGAYTQLDTNGSIPETVVQFSSYLDAIGLDIKGNESNIEYLTGVQRELSLFKPLETLKLSKNFGCLVEFKTIMFDFIDLKHLEWLYELIPKNAYWEWIQYRP